MGGGSRIKQYERRFFEGEQIRGEREDEIFHIVKTFRNYEVREAESGGHELLKSGEVVGIFSEARVEEDRIIFRLSHGMNLEVSEKGIREILSPEKAELCGLTAADGTICKYKGKGGSSVGYEVSLTSVSPELIGVFKELAGDTYDMTPHEHIKHHKTKEGEKEHYHIAIYSKKVAYDLWDLGIKGPEPYEFHPPIQYLDDEGKKAYLRGFFSGDGNVSMTKEGEHKIRIYSSYKEGLNELKEMFEDLGFHPSEIHEKYEKPAPGRHRKEYNYYFSIPEEDHLRFIEEIGSEKLEHKRKFELIKLINGRKKKEED
ncbi:MAG: hypothetical protein FGF51_04010 [Candidatus Brockarchaeota archaeon]|nr:hypothetical protein [Candidatus Brockarchaeota archaeon]